MKTSKPVIREAGGDSELSMLDTVEEVALAFLAAIPMAPMYLLGALGRLLHFRCRDCEAQYCHEAEKDESYDEKI